MSNVFENGNVSPLSLGDRWTPKLNGAIFCSPACGFKCKKVDFDHAMESAATLANQLGNGWRPCVWENGGWYFEVKKGAATVSVDEAGEYTATIRFHFEDDHENCLSESRQDPREAVAALVERMNQRVATLKRALVSVSLSPLEILDV
jgi:hypothetical protein